MEAQYAEKVAAKYAPKVAQMLGLQNPGIEIRVAQLPEGTPASTSGNVITIDADLPKGRDTAGAIVHEMVHAFQAVPGGYEGPSGKLIEPIADSIRARLGLGKGEGYGSRVERVLTTADPSVVRDVAQQMSDGKKVTPAEVYELANQNPNNQGTQNGGNRMRNTFANLLSKYNVNYQNPGGSAAVPLVSPGEMSAYYQQQAAIAAMARQLSAAARTERVGIRARLKTDRAAIKADAVDAMAQAAGDSAERQITGSSIDISNRIGVEAQKATALAGAKTGALQELAQNRLGLQQGQLELSQQALGLEQQMAARQQDILAQQLQNNLIVSGQETQMDVLRAMYEEMSSMMTPQQRSRLEKLSAQPWRRRGPGSYTETSYGASWQTGGGF